MGDMIKKTSTLDKIKAREQRKIDTVHTENETIEKITSSTKGKNKIISARVNETTYQAFKATCEAKGISANACINMLITDFVNNNKGLLS